MSEDLRRFVLPDETALQLFARSYSEPFATGVFFLGTVRAGQIYEVSGPSNSGKTTLLLQVNSRTFGAADRLNCLGAAKYHFVL